jgi:AAA+ superfamily predicted ATPase
MTIVREIQPETPIVVLMEDLEVLMRKGSRSETLNILDGVYTEAIQKVVYLATTNNPEELERRITNRPSRFDRVFIVGNPNEASRKMYLQSLGEWDIETQVPIEQAVKDSENFSFGHLKELFTAIVVFEKPYDKVIKELQEMIEASLPTGHELEYGPLKGEASIGFGQKSAGKLRNRTWRG